MFTLGTLSPLTSGVPFADQAIVQFHEGVGGIPIRYRRTNLIQNVVDQTPDDPALHAKPFNPQKPLVGVIGSMDTNLSFMRRRVFLGRPLSRRGLMTAPLAPGVQTSTPQNVGKLMTAGRTLKPVTPAVLPCRFETCGFDSEAILLDQETRQSLFLDDFRIYTITVP